MLVALQVGVTARGDDGVVHGMRRSSRAQAERRRSEEELRAAVWFARDHGVTWERIGEILDLTPLEAARRFGPHWWRPGSINRPENSSKL